MKNLRLFYITFLLLIMSNNLYSQGNLYIDIQPSSPIINDEIKLFTHVSFPKVGAYKTHQLTWIDNNNLHVELYYTLGWQQMSTFFIDSMPLGQLSEGLYTIIADLKVSTHYTDFDDMSYYYKQDSDTITFRVDETLGIDELNEKMNFLLFPNPVTSDLTINTKDIIEEILIMNSLGEIVLRRELNKIEGSGSITIDLSDLAKGMYTCFLRTKEGVVSEKIVKL
ncbi:MAG: T9SS type A sorting domain-containing protein [Brumimicrobium sp.]